MPRPLQIPRRPDLTDAHIKTAEYVGSGEHKAERWWGGLPEAHVDKKTGRATRPKKQDTTICPKVTTAERNQATGWVQAALSAKQYRYFEGDKTYPKHIWYRDGDQYWFGFAVNQIAGTYKGWPISEADKLEAFD